jgi:Ni/Fe-hydrogenase subunit HybB-like protein
MAAKNPEQINDDLLRPLSGASASYVIAFACLAAIVIAAACAFGWQVYAGLGVSGLRSPVFWGFYITNFVFWIGLSHAGTLISAILRLANATWRRPVTRCAEVITVFALSIGAAFPVVHLGRPWLAFWLFPYPSERGIWPNIRSPLLWDFFAINTYLLSSVTFLLLPMLPDLALVRDRATSGAGSKLRCISWPSPSSPSRFLYTASSPGTLPWRSSQAGARPSSPRTSSQARFSVGSPR